MGVQQRAEEFTLDLRHGIDVKVLRFPRRTRRDQEPADAVRTISADDFEWIHRVAPALGHLLPVLIQNKIATDDVLKARLFEQERTDGMKRIEPAASLIDCFGNESGR